MNAVMYYSVLFLLTLSITPFEASNTILLPVNFIEAIYSVNQRIESRPDRTFHDINHEQSTSVQTILESLDWTAFPNVSKTCVSQFLEILKALTQKQEWVVRLFDAYGKPTSGLLDGSFIWLGEFSECLKIHVQQIDFQGKYCLAKLSAVNSTLQIAYGVCMPKQCSSDDITQVINAGIERIPKTIVDALPFSLSPLTSADLTCQQQDKPFDALAIVAIVVLSLIAFIVTLATIFDMSEDYYRKYRLKRDERIANMDSFEEINEVVPLVEQQNEHSCADSAFFKLLKAFSFYTNSQKVFSVTQGADQLNCLKLYSSFILSLGHFRSYLPLRRFHNELCVEGNIVDGLDLFKRYSFQIVIGGSFAVDSFFLLSGLLTCYIFLKEAGSKVSCAFLAKYYFHRFWRLSPTYMILLLFEIALTRYIGSGPVFPTTDGFERNMCKETWWTNVLYINNFVNIDNICYGITWYLSADMQFHWISPLILVPLVFKKQLIALIIAGALLFGSLLSTVLILVFNPGMELGSNGPLLYKFMKYVYLAPWSRIPPFLIGVLLGYVLFKRKNKETVFELRLITNAIGWIISLFLCSSVVFWLYPDYNGNPWSRPIHILYQSLSRTLWSIGLAFIIYSNLTGHGGLINKILSWQVWTPLARLSYSAYLVHHIVLIYFYTTMQQPFFIQDEIMVYYFLSTLSISYAIAFIVSTFIEIPFIQLEKFMFNKARN